MDYIKHYERLVSKGKNRILEGYCEKHHIIPKCMGGPDVDENIVMLTAEEHYLAHLLLVKIHPSVTGLIYAANMMCVGRNNKRYGWVKRRWVDILKMREVTDETRKKISISQKARLMEQGHPRGMLGKFHSTETKALFSEQRSGKNNVMYNRKHSDIALEKMRNCVKTDEHKQKLSLSKQGIKNPNYAKPRSIETKNKIAIAMKNSKIVECPHCGKEGKISPMHRWHFDKCKLKVNK